MITHQGKKVFKMNAISKEFMSKVLGYEVEMVKTVIGNTLYFNNEEHGDSINIYELAHKCKAHYVKEGNRFTIKCDSVVISKKTDMVYYLVTIQNMGQGDVFIPYDPLHEIKACQWIYNFECQRCLT